MLKYILLRTIAGQSNYIRNIKIVQNKVSTKRVGSTYKAEQYLLWILGNITQHSTLSSRNVVVAEGLRVQTSKQVLKSYSSIFQVRVVEKGTSKHEQKVVILKLFPFSWRGSPSPQYLWNFQTPWPFCYSELKATLCSTENIAYIEI